LTESDWLYLIPRLPMNARGFLRHRRDLPFSARQVLERLGVGDLVLPQPDLVHPATDFGQAVSPPSPGNVPAEPDEADAGITELVKRIEAFQRARQRNPAPEGPGPTANPVEPRPLPEVRAFDFASDARGQVVWANPAIAPLVVGLVLGPCRPWAVAQLDEAATRALAQRRPVRGGRLEFSGLPAIAGEWRMDATPQFTPETGQFAGYEGRLRRPAVAPLSDPAAAPANTPAAGDGDRIRQVLHELRTPVNAIQGFAELIQQQMFGPTPNEYRALAAAVAVDAARLLAGFDEIDRLARLESGALRLDEGQSDFRAAVAGIQRRLDGVL